MRCLQRRHGCQWRLHRRSVRRRRLYRLRWQCVSRLRRRRLLALLMLHMLRVLLLLLLGAPLLLLLQLMEKLCLRGRLC